MRDGVKLSARVRERAGAATNRDDGFELQAIEEIEHRRVQQAFELRALGRLGPQSFEPFDLFADERFNSVEKVIENIDELRGILDDAALDYETDDILAALRSSDWEPDTEVPQEAKRIIEWLRPEFIFTTDWMRECVQPSLV